MAKYLFFTDAHLKGVNPSRRTDNYYESWIIKFKELLSLAKKHKVDYILDGGDFLDTPLISNIMVDEILDLIEEAGVKFRVMFGNHPLVGHNRETSNGSSLAHMINRCSLLSEGPDLQDDYAIFKFVDYKHNIENEIKESGIMINSSDDKWKIALVHAMITDKPFHPDVLHVVADDIKTNVDLMLLGHYHEPWTKTVGSTEFLNIGAFGRTSIREVGIHPSVLLIDTKKRSHEIIKLKKAKDGASVFDLSKKEKEESTNDEIETFISSLKNFKAQSLDLRNDIERLGKEQDVPREVLDIIIKKCGEVES